MAISKTQIKAFQIENTLGFFINRLSFVMRQHFTSTLKETGLDLTPEECAILNQLWQKDGQMQNELAESTIRDQTTVTRMIDKLEKKKIVFRENSAEDRRRVLAWLTPEGKELRFKVVPIIMELLAKISEPISARDMKITTATLQKILDALLADQEK